MHFAILCHAFKPVMHHTCLRIMPCLCDVCLLCCLFLSGLLLSLASVSFRSCEDSFDYIRLSSTWTRSSSLRDLRQDDHYPRYHFYLCLLVASFYRFAALPITCLSSHPKLPWTSNLWHLSYANHCLAMLPLLLSPSYSVASCRWSWSLFHVGTWICWDITISLI